MVARVNTAAFQGIEMPSVDVQVQTAAAVHRTYIAEVLSYSRINPLL